MSFNLNAAENLSRDPLTGNALGPLLDDLSLDSFLLFGRHDRRLRGMVEG